MTTELEKSLAEIITAAVKTGESAKEFITAQTPDVLQQVLAWNFWASIFWGMFCLISFIGISVLSYKIGKKCPAFYSEGPGFLLPSVGLMGFGFPMMINFSIALQIYVAPKVWLIGYAASLVK